MSMISSPIQNHIISKLKNAESLRYAELQEGLNKVPNDLFNYHLQFLVKKEFIIRLDDGYTLSPKGIKYVADPHVPTFPYHLFKVNPITIVSKVVDGGTYILNQKRTSNPSYGKVGIPGGMARKGELLENAAQRKLHEETGLVAESFRLVGIERRMQYKHGELFSDMIFPLMYTASWSGSLRADSPFGSCMWVPIDEAIKHEKDPYDSIAGIVRVLSAIKDNTIENLPFFFDEQIQEDNR